MKKIFSVAIICALAVSCLKKESDSNPRNDFSYSTTTEVISNPSAKSGGALDILNGDQIIAKNIQNPTPLVVGNAVQLTSRSTQFGATDANGNTISKVFFPSETEYATMMFEDLFPSKGDYDMNDAVIKFRYEFECLQGYNYPEPVINSLTVTILPRAIGSALEPVGLALAINCDNLVVSSVDRSSDVNLQNLFDIDVKGIETGTDVTRQVVIPITGNLKGHFENKDDAGMINVYDSKALNSGQEFTVKINFSKKIEFSEVTIFNTNPAKYDIDLFALFENRGKEVHVKGSTPTALFNRNYFVEIGKTDFSTKDNYIWALMVPKSIVHPLETQSIEKAYPDFGRWVQSQGASEKSWYDRPNMEYCYDKFEK